MTAPQTGPLVSDDHRSSVVNQGLILRSQPWPIREALTISLYARADTAPKDGDRLING